MILCWCSTFAPWCWWFLFGFWDGFSGGNFHLMFGLDEGENCLGCCVWCLGLGGWLLHNILWRYCELIIYCIYAFQLPIPSHQHSINLICVKQGFSVSFISSIASLTIEMRLLTRLCKITMINKMCTHFLSYNIPTTLLIQSVRCACVHPPT